MNELISVASYVWRQSGQKLFSGFLIDFSVEEKLHLIFVSAAYQSLFYMHNFRAIILAPQKHG